MLELKQFTGNSVNHEHFKWTLSVMASRRWRITRTDKRCICGGYQGKMVYFARSTWGMSSLLALCWCKVESSLHWCSHCVTVLHTILMNLALINNQTAHNICSHILLCNWDNCAQSRKNYVNQQVGNFNKGASWEKWHCLGFSSFQTLKIAQICFYNWGSKYW